MSELVLRDRYALGRMLGGGSATYLATDRETVGSSVVKDHPGIPRFIDHFTVSEDGELFRVGAMVRFPAGSYRLALDYP